MLGQAAQSGILWYTARKNRPKKIPEPFFIVYGASATFIPEGEMTICEEEGRLKLPAPEGLSETTKLRWIVVRESTLTYYLKDMVDIDFGEYASGDTGPNMGNPSSINNIPNLGFAQADDTGDD